MAAAVACSICWYLLAKWLSGVPSLTISGGMALCMLDDVPAGIFANILLQAVFGSSCFNIKKAVERFINRLINFDFLTTIVCMEFFYFCGGTTNLLNLLEVSTWEGKILKAEEYCRR